MLTYDRMTIDSTGVFMIGELERLDQELHGPLVDYTWSRDIDLREDVSIADEVSSFTNSTFAAAGGINPKGKAWVGKTANAISRMMLDIGKTSHPLFLWAMEIAHTIPELLSAQQLGRPIDSQMYDGMQLKLQMDIDEMVYIGDSDLGHTGLINQTSPGTSGNVVNGALGSPLWSRKTPDEIVADVTTLINAVWAASGWKICPSRLLLSPTRYGYIGSQKIGNAANETILSYIIDKCVLPKEVNGRPLEVKHCKWCEPTPRSALTHRMVAYTKDRRFVRFPLVPLQRTPLEYRSLFHITTYFGRLGVVEVVYSETVGYADGM